jgi:hypothetical protein
MTQEKTAIEQKRKLKLEQILKPGAKLTAKRLDTKKVKKMFKRLRKEQDAILACKNVDWEKLAHTYITI